MRRDCIKTERAEYSNHEAAKAQRQTLRNSKSIPFAFDFALSPLRGSPCLGCGEAAMGSVCLRWLSLGYPVEKSCRIVEISDEGDMRRVVTHGQVAGKRLTHMPTQKSKVLAGGLLRPLRRQGTAAFQSLVSTFRSFKRILGIPNPK